MRDKIARKMAEDLADSLGWEFARDSMASTSLYLRGKDRARNRIRTLEADTETLKAQVAALNLALQSMVEAAKPTCKTCGQKIGAPESGKRTGGK